MAENTKAAAPAEAAAAEAQPLTFKLAKPVDAHGEAVKELVVREPTGMDIMRAGNPVLIDFNMTPPQVSFDAPKMRAMIATLCSVPTSTVDKLSAKDWNTVAWGVASFFIPDMAQL
jgi:hypothetical protein